MPGTPYTGPDESQDSGLLAVLSLSVADMAEQYEDAQFVEYVVKAIVDNPQDVRVERTVDEMGVLCTLHVNPSDLGQVIGRQGQTAKSVRTLLRVVGAKNHARVNMKIYEPEGYRKYKGEMGGKPMEPHAAPAHSDAADDLKL